MIDEKRAKELAQKHIAVKLLDRTDDNFVILEEYTRKGDWGWLFIWESAKFIKSNDYRDQLIGNVPIIVSTEGRVYQTGTANDLEYYIEEFKKGNLTPVS